MQLEQFPKYLDWIDGLEPEARGPSAKRTRVVAVTSGKAGVGKSSIAVHLGLTLARRGRQVCILDADTGPANVSTLLGLLPSAGLEHVLAGECPIENIMLNAAYGLKVIPGANCVSEFAGLDPARQQRLLNDLRRVEDGLDYVLLDTLAGVSETTLDFLRAADRVLLVITPEPSSLSDAFALLKLALSRHPVICHVVVNMTASSNEARAVFQRFQGVVAKYLGADTDYLGFIQRDESIRATASLQHSVSLLPDTDPSSRLFQRLADALEEQFSQKWAGAGLGLSWLRRFMEPAGIGAAPTEQPRSGIDYRRSSDRPLGSESTKVEQGELPDRLTALRAKCWDMMEEMEDARLLAQWLEGLHARYWDRFGRPAVDLKRLLDRLDSDPLAHADILARLRDRFQGGLPETVPLSEPCTEPEASRRSKEVEDVGTGCVEGADYGAQTTFREASKSHFLDEPRDDFTVATSDLNRPAAHVLAEQRTGRKHPHAYDQERFGAQRELIECLRQTDLQGGTLLELIRPP